MQLVRDAIAAGIFNDLVSPLHTHTHTHTHTQLWTKPPLGSLLVQGSGSHVDLCVITADKVEYLRPYDIANKKGERAGDYRYKKGTTGLWWYCSIL